MCLSGGNRQPTPQPQPAPPPPPIRPDANSPLQSTTRQQQRQTRNQARRTQVTGPGGVGAAFGASSVAPTVFGQTGAQFPV